MSVKVRIVVPDDEEPDRLDRFLGLNAPELSRTRAKDLIVDGSVTLNGAQVKPSTEVLPGDVIEADVPELEPMSAKGEDIPLDVCYEDDDIIVVEKPAGMVVHPAPGSRSGTLVNALLGRGVGLSGLGGTLRPGIVHRLDKNTSGLMVVARTDRAHRALSAMFHDREVSKTYVALVWGTFDDDEGTIEEPIGRRPNDRKKMAVVEGGRPARTTWRVRENFPFAAYVSIGLETGRTHQARVHLAHIRRPVIGDPDYGGVKTSFGDVGPHYRLQAKRISASAGRQALHARAISFRHPVTAKEMRFASPLPDDMAAMLAALRNPEGESGRIIGVDPGEARVGVAVSDEGRMIARPLPTILADGDAGVAARLAELVDELDADVLVMGNPVLMDGRSGSRAARSRELAAAVEDACRVRVVLWDERLSSVAAERIMRERGERSRGRKGRVDALAASVILQSYLDAFSGPGSGGVQT